MERGTSGDSPHPVDRHVGRRVREKRIDLGYNQSDLARALGLTFQQVQKYEKGVNRISASKLWDVARFFKVEVGYFFEGLGESAAEGANVHHFPATRQTLDIGRMVPQLPVRSQKLILELVRDLAGQIEAEPETA